MIGFIRRSTTAQAIICIVGLFALLFGLPTIANNLKTYPSVVVDCSFEHFCGYPQILIGDQDQNGHPDVANYMAMGFGLGAFRKPNPQEVAEWYRRNSIIPADQANEPL